MKFNRLFLFVGLFLALFSVSSYGQELPFEVRFVGNLEFSQSGLQKELAKCRIDLTDAETDEKLVSRLEYCLRGTVFELYSSRGLLEVRKTTEIRVEATETKRTATISIKEPTPTFFNSLTVRQSTFQLTETGQIQERFPLKEGERINFVSLRSFVNGLRTEYFNAGYLAFDIDFDTESIEHEDGRKLQNLTVTIHEGQPFVISEIAFERLTGYMRLSDEELSNHFGLKVGQIYSEKDLQQGLKRLNSVCRSCELRRSTNIDPFGGSGSAANLDVSEDFENRTVRIVVSIAEHQSFQE